MSDLTYSLRARVYVYVYVCVFVARKNEEIKINDGGGARNRLKEEYILGCTMCSDKTIFKGKQKLDVLRKTDAWMCYRIRVAFSTI